MSPGFALAAQLNLHRNINLTARHLRTHTLDKNQCRFSLAPQKARFLRHAAKITWGKAEPATG
jgi:hypothetical protein